MPSSIARRDNELKIGDLERKTGVSRSSIQHYVRLGLLPAPRKLGPRLFLFDTQHFEALLAVRRLREEHVPLTEIRARLRSRTSSRPTSAGPVRAKTSESSAPVSQNDPRRTAILEAATRLFAQHGYQSVRLADVGREVGLSKAALYQSFESKEALFIECIDHIRLLVVPKDKRDAGKREPDLTRRAYYRASAVLGSFASYRMLTNLLVGVANGRDRELARKARDAYHRMVTDVVAELELGVQAGMYRPGNLELDAYMLWGALMGAGDFMAASPGASVKAIAQAFLELMTLGTQPTRLRMRR